MRPNCSTAFFKYAILTMDAARLHTFYNAKQYIKRSTWLYHIYIKRTWCNKIQKTAIVTSHDIHIPDLKLVKY
jgi:hypothetical protein